MSKNSPQRLIEKNRHETDNGRSRRAQSNGSGADPFLMDEHQKSPDGIGTNEPPSLGLPDSTLRQMSIVGMTEDHVRSLAVAKFEADPAHAIRRAQAAGGLATLKENETGSAEDRERLLESCAKADRWAQGRRAGFTLAAIYSPTMIFLAIRILLLVFVMLASVQNGLYFLETSGFELSRGKIDALAISAIFSLGPAILSKWILSGLSDLWRFRFEAVLKALSLPVAVFGLLVFAIVFGQAQEQVDLFAAPGSQGGWDIPIWVLLGTSMALESLASIALVSSCVSDFQQLVPVCTVDGEQYSVASKKLELANAVFAKRASQRAQLEAEIRAHDAEKDLFVERCLALFRAYTAQLQLDMQSQEARLAGQASATKQKQLFQN